MIHLFDLPYINKDPLIKYVYKISEIALIVDLILL